MTELEPTWDLNTGRGKMLVKQYQQLILYRVKHGLPKSKNVSKLYQVTQGANKNLSAFYERLYEIARKQTDLKPDDEANKVTFNILFIGQSAFGIWKKLQKVHAFSGMSISLLIQIAYKVYDN